MKQQQTKTNNQLVASMLPRWLGVSRPRSIWDDIGCLWLVSWIYPQSYYHDGSWIVTACTDGGFIVLPNWDTRLPAPWLGFTLSHIILTLSKPHILVMSHARLGNDTNTLSKSLVWLGQESNSWRPKGKHACALMIPNDKDDSDSALFVTL